jgi:hypothetical protein
MLRHIVEAVAIVCAGIWAFYTFIYQEKIKPASEPAALNAGISVSSLGRSRNRDIMGLAIVLRNTGKTEIDIAADGYNVWGERYGAHPIVRKREQPNQHAYDAGLPIVSRRLVTAFAELRDSAVGGRLGTHIIIEPGALETIRYVFAVPRGDYDIIHAQVIAVPVKTTTIAKVPVAIQTNRVGGYWLQPAPNAGVEEDDNSTDLVLPP